jgi:ribonucleoside-diphosphate reductase alpha chain
MYYLRSTAAADAIKFTINKASAEQPAGEVVKETTPIVAMPVPQGTGALAAAIQDSQQAIPYETYTEEQAEAQKRTDMACSLDNPDACEACGS